jgi:pimeloyl-ACP methyl ester carboxylesterase
MREGIMATPNHLTPGGARRIAYHRTPAGGEGASRPGVLFLGGYGSDMTGSKAAHLEAWARARGRAFVRFDYSGHGASAGRLEDGCVGDWAEEALAVLEALTEGPQVLVGSSMGGWIALLLARRAPERIAALVGVAAAPDFTEDLIWAGLDADQRARLLTEGRFALPNRYGPEPRVITRRLIEDGRARLVLRSALPLPFPVRLVHGTADPDVPAEVALRLLAHIACPDARLTLLKDGDHRLSGPAELALLAETVEAAA